MMDWLFDETPSGHMASIGTCQPCYEHYHALRSALHSFDQAAEAMQPDESYWAGYEAGLRVKLAADAAPKRSWLSWRWGWLVPATLGIVLLLFAAMGNSRAPQTAQGSEDQIAMGNAPGPRNNEPEQSPAKDAQKRQRPDKPVKPERKPPTRAPEKKPYLLNDPNPMMALNVSDPFVHPATTKHFERAQMLLRAFRNAPETTNASFDLTYEKKRARLLLYETVVLRREAETRGDWPMEEVLNALEPLLLDIANLPNRPTQDDVMPIRERMQKQEIVAKLQLYATPVTVAALDE
ncbi:MAG TPA: hypothetical protein VFZ34_05575 [Blastocatellia bacterium]|nr:hypothetical protein [Blastocatellia bacterium]